MWKRTKPDYFIANRMDAQCLVYSAVNWFYVCFKAKSDVT